VRCLEFVLLADLLRVHLAQLFLWIVATGMAGHTLLRHGILV
jgi:hypothetical protein